MRAAGILLPVSSLPSDFGVGDFGKHGYLFVELLKNAGIKLWQILPLNPLGYGNSPYQPFSSYAGDELYLDLYSLKEEGLIHELVPFRKESSTVDYEAVRKYKNIYLKEAFSNFVLNREYEEFIKEEWVYYYAVFFALKKQNKMICWNEWPKEEQDWILNKKYNLSHLDEEINYQMFLQFIFDKQWKKLKEFANLKEVQIVGDVPFYVGIDSLDVWCDRKNFLLDNKANPTFIAGVPPDFFSNTGQRWGNPIYDWDYMEKDGFHLWINRLRYSAKQFDIIRIDHFRAFDTYWKIPASSETAVEGDWVEAPGYKFFDALFKELKAIKMVVEDLGDLRPEVLDLRDYYNFKGMDVAQFSLLSATKTGITNQIIYTGTHDNQTVRGWYRLLSKKDQWKVHSKFFMKRCFTGPISWKMITYSMMREADYVIVPIQDFLDMDDIGRINTPGTLGSPNWEWKLTNFKNINKKISKIEKLIKKAGR